MSHQNGEATALRVKVERGGVTKIDLSLPARAARWIVEVIPSDVALRITEKGFDLNALQERFNEDEYLRPQSIFLLEESHRTVRVWLE